ESRVVQQEVLHGRGIEVLGSGQDSSCVDIVLAIHRDGLAVVVGRGSTQLSGPDKVASAVELADEDAVRAKGVEVEGARAGVKVHGAPVGACEIDVALAIYADALAQVGTRPAQGVCPEQTAVAVEFGHEDVAAGGHAGEVERPRPGIKVSGTGKVAGDVDLAL